MCKNICKIVHVVVVKYHRTALTLYQATLYGSDGGAAGEAGRPDWQQGAGVRARV